MRRRILFAIKFFLFLSFTSGMIGCLNTTGILKIKGKVLDEETKTGIPLKNIIVQGLVFSNDKQEPIEAAEFSTDSSGNFSFSFKKIKDARYYNFCMVGDSDYLFTTKTLGLMEIEKNAEFLSFSLNKLTNLTIKIYRKSKSPACDTIRLIWGSDGAYGWALWPYKIINYGVGNSSGLNPNFDLYWIGGEVNSTITTKVFSGKRTELIWEIYRNGTRKLFTDTITCKRDFANIVYFTY
jgi:hypothetical protein